VSAPRDPRALADNILQLARDAPLRNRLGDAGRDLIDALYPSWPQAAVAFADALIDQLRLHERGSRDAVDAANDAGVGA
jgi:hypothetical protein